MHIHDRRVRETPAFQRRECTFPDSLQLLNVSISLAKTVAQKRYKKPHPKKTGPFHIVNEKKSLNTIRKYGITNTVSIDGLTAVSPRPHKPRYTTTLAQLEVDVPHDSTFSDLARISPMITIKSSIRYPNIMTKSTNSHM